MDYETFLNKCKKITGFNYRYSGSGRVPDSLIKEWLIGGQTGGSCWAETNEHYSLKAEPEPEFEELDKVLEALCPNISFLQYKNLNKIITISERNQNDYYGNYSSYAIKEIKLFNLYEFLNDRRLFD